MARAWCSQSSRLLNRFNDALCAWIVWQKAKDTLQVLAFELAKALLIFVVRVSLALTVLFLIFAFLIEYLQEIIVATLFVILIKVTFWCTFT